MCYLIMSEDKQCNFVEIFDKDELFFKNDELSFAQIICLNEAIIDLKIKNTKMQVVDLSEFIENETHEWVNFYNKDTWGNIFWLLGYELNSDNSDDSIWERIISNSSEIILFYIQNIAFISLKLPKGRLFKRFRQLLKYYEDHILIKENNTMFLKMISKFKEEWIII